MQREFLFWESNHKIKRSIQSSNSRRTVKSQNKKALLSQCFFHGAGSRGRTDTVLLPSDFESDASANSTIPAWPPIFISGMYYSI